MTKPSDNGLVVDRTYGDMEEAVLQDMDRMMLLIADLLDGGSTDVALKTAVEIYGNNAKLLRILGMLIHKRHGDAETAAMHLVAVDKRKVGM